MTKDEILKVVNRKGAVVKELFYTIFIVFKYEKKRGIYILCDERFDDDDKIATFCYNVTILMTNIVLDNPTFFDYYGVRENNRKRARKDLETMQRLEYGDDFDEVEMEFEENDYVYSFDPNSEY
jgi:hypothetical protein